MKMLKYAIVGLLAIGLVSAAIAATVTNRLGQVITTTTSDTGVTTTITAGPNAAATVTNRTVLPVGCQLDTGTDTDATLFTPRNYGDMLIGQEGSTGKVWVATGLTTNDWKATYDP